MRYSLTPCAVGLSAGLMAVMVVAGCTTSMVLERRNWTLVRYLDELRKNPEKRSQLLKISQGELIPRPDSQVFYEENLKLMRRIYGDSILDDWRTRELQGGKKRV